MGIMEKKMETRGIIGLSCILGSCEVQKGEEFKRRSLMGAPSTGFF